MLMLRRCRDSPLRLVERHSTDSDLSELWGSCGTEPWASHPDSAPACALSPALCSAVSTPACSEAVA